MGASSPLDATLSRRIATTKAPRGPGATFGSDALAFCQQGTRVRRPTRLPRRPWLKRQPVAAAGGGGGAAVPMVPGQPWLLATTKNSIVAFEDRRRARTRR